MRGRISILVLLALTAVSAHGLAQGPGPGDPTTVFASGFSWPCRMAFDANGNLFVNDRIDEAVYSLAPDGTRSVFIPSVNDPTDIAFDPFGHLLISSVAEGVVYKASATGELTEFLTVTRAVRLTTGPDGSLWVLAVDTLYRYDALGRPLQSIDVSATGGSWDLEFSPSGDLYLSNFFSLWRLSNGEVEAVATELQRLNWGKAFDALGNLYWAHTPEEEEDVARVVLHTSDGSIAEHTLVSEVEDPCHVAFGRDPGGSTNARLFVSQRQTGNILEVNPAGVLAPGWPVVGLSLSEIDEEDCADAVVGVPTALSESEATFLDVIGNNNGSYDVGDFRAYLVLTGVVNGS